MKKILYILALFIGLFVLTGNVNAQIVQTDIKEAVEEEIAYFGNEANFKDNETFMAYQEYVSMMKKADLSEYKEDDSKVNIYIFRGSTCWHCLDEISWLSTQVKEYGKYFNIKTFEVWENKDNNKLMNAVAKKLGINVDGVPFTVVGKKYYSGFSEETGKQIINEAKNQFEDKNRYDVNSEIDFSNGTDKSGGSKQSNAVMVVLILIVVVAGIGAIVYISKSK